MNDTEGTLYTSWVEEVVRDLQTRQSELHDVEAKRAETDLPRQIYKTFSAFGNRPGGGMLILGVDERQAFAVSGVADIAKAQHDLLNFVNNEMSYPIRLEPTVADIDGRQVLAVKIMEVPIQQKPVYYKPLGLDKGSYWRSSTSNVQMTPEQVRQLIVDHVEQREDFSARLVSNVPEDWYDPLEMERIRRVLRALRSGSGLDALSDSELLAKLQMTEESGDSAVPTITGLLLVGREPYLKQYVPQHEVTFLTHVDETEDYDSRSDMKAPLVAILESVEQRLEAANRIVPIQVGLHRLEISRLHPAVYREAVLNAAIHRNYTDYGSVFVRLYPARLDVTSPGGFLPGVGVGNLLAGNPRHRNRRLAETFQLLGLVERAGMGVPKMYRYQLEQGKRPPEYDADVASVRVSIPTDQVDERLAAFVAMKVREGFKFDVADLIVLNHLRSARDIRTVEAAAVTQRKPAQATKCLSAMVDKDLLKRRGTGSGTVFNYSARVAKILGQAAKSVISEGIESVRHPEMVMQYVRRQGRITNSECRELCDLTLSQATKLLTRMVATGQLARQGTNRRLMYYVAADQA